MSNERELKQLERLGQVLRAKPEPKLSADFDRMFFERLEASTKLPSGRWTAPRAALSALRIVSLVAIVAVGTSMALVPVQRPYVDALHGDVAVESGTAPRQAMTPGRRIKVGDKIITGPKDWVILEYNGRYRVQVHPGSELVVDQLRPFFRPGGTVFHLSRGETLVSIGDDTHKKYPIKVETQYVTAKAMGTQFVVAANEGADSQSMVAVVKGAVEVSSKAQGAPQTVSVEAGHQIVLSPKEGVLKSRLLDTAQKHELEEQFQFSKTDQAILLIGMGPRRVDELLEPCAIYLRYRSKQDSLAEISDVIKSIQRAVASGKTSDHGDAVAALETLAQKQDRLNPVPLLLFVGAYYEYLGDHAGAVRVFEKTAREYPASLLRPLALMAAARIYATGLNDAASAERLARQILDQYPDSFEAVSARKLIPIPTSS